MQQGDCGAALVSNQLIRSGVTTGAKAQRPGLLRRTDGVLGRSDHSDRHEGGVSACRSLMSCTSHTQARPRRPSTSDSASCRRSTSRGWPRRTCVAWCGSRDLATSTRSVHLDIVPLHRTPPCHTSPRPTCPPATRSTRTGGRLGQRVPAERGLVPRYEDRQTDQVTPAESNASRRPLAPPHHHPPTHAPTCLPTCTLPARC